ncbi:hypothetical protein ACOMHN_023998 [Nucella lapillus]
MNFYEMASAGLQPPCNTTYLQDRQTGLLTMVSTSLVVLLTHLALHTHSNVKSRLSQDRQTGLLTMVSTSLVVLLTHIALHTHSNVKSRPSQECIDPSQFRAVVSTVQEMAGFNPEQGTLKIPTLAQRLGQTLQKCARIVKSAALQAGDQVLKAKACEFLELMQSDWTAEITTFAQQTLQTRRFNKPKILPLANDVTKLNAFLEQRASRLYVRLQDESSPPSVETWEELNKMTLAQIVLFNRRRAGEAERTQLSQFMDGMKTGKANSLQEELCEGLSEVEHHLISVLDRFEIRGKRGRKVPVILTPRHKERLMCLVKHRVAVGVLDDNKFLFARTGSAQTPLRGSDVIREFSHSCGAEQPLLITSTSLRKHIATMSQLLNLKRHELDALAAFMGHNIDVHRDFYRLPEDSMQLAKISKLLLQMEAGRIGDMRGKSLDEITEQEVGLNESDEESHQRKLQGKRKSRSNDTEANCQAKKTEVEMLSMPEEKRGRLSNDITSSMKLGEVEEDAIWHACRKKSNPKRKWHPDEKAGVEDCLSKFIRTETLPGKRHCEEAKRKDPRLSTRHWSQIKFCVKNLIAANKRKLQKMT